MICQEEKCKKRGKFGNCVKIGKLFLNYLTGITDTRRMETQRQEFRIGIMVLTCIVCLIVMTFFFGKRPVINLGGGENTVLVRFQRAPGITRNTPVFKNGIQIGRVARVELVDNDQMVEVTIHLDKGRKLYTDEECRIQQAVITGNTSVNFVKKFNFTGKVEEMDPQPYLVGVSSGDLLSGFGNLEGDLTKVVQGVANFMERLNSVVGTPEELGSYQEKLSAIVNETRLTMNSMRQATDGLGRIVNDPAVHSNVRQLIIDLPDVVERSRVLVGESTQFVRETRGLIEKGSDSLENLSAGLEKVSRTLEVITKIADQVEDDVPETITAIKRSAIRLESLFSELTMIVQNIRTGDGTVMRLVRDADAYEKILATLDNIEKITDEVDWMLRTDAKPIAHNVKVLTDKAARDPAIFIRNLLRKEPPIKNVPYCFGRGMCGTSSYRPMTFIDGEYVEIIEEIPVSVPRQSRMTTPSRYETVQPMPSEGRIVNVDPRYAVQ